MSARRFGVVGFRAIRIEEIFHMRAWLLGASATLTLTLTGHAAAQQPVAADKATTAAAPAHGSAAPSALAALLETQVRAAWEAFKNKDRAGYAKFLTDDFQAVESDGEGERARLHVLREVEHSMYTSYLLQFFEVQPLGADYAFVTYESSMQFPRTATLRFRRVFIGELWTRRSGQWKMMRYQETLVR
jgi:hypothetical protein